MSETIPYAMIKETAAVVGEAIQEIPKAGLVLGSGLGDLAQLVESPRIVPYQRLPHWPQSTVAGHSGQLVIGKLFGCEVLIQQGRAHYYEGWSMAEVTLPVRVMKVLGINTIVLTNAAGAIHPDYTPGDVMLISDQIALVAMTGLNPLRGANLSEFGPRFPDMSQIYDREYRDWVRQICQQEDFTLQEGVYCGLSGPSFESPADLRFLRTIGADAVGMSTVPEAIVARHASMRVLGLSGISNKANLDGNSITTHEEVLAAGKMIVPKMTAILKGFLARLAGG